LIKFKQKRMRDKSNGSLIEFSKEWVSLKNTVKKIQWNNAIKQRLSSSQEFTEH
jgi:hypothetical protein